MKNFIDIHTVLSTSEDMEDNFDEAEHASDKLNMILHMVYDRADEDIDQDKLQSLLADTWEYWHKERYLVDIEVDDLVDWVDHLFNNWNNADEEYDDA